MKKAIIFVCLLAAIMLIFGCAAPADTGNGSLGPSSGGTSGGVQVTGTWGGTDACELVTEDDFKRVVGVGEVIPADSRDDLMACSYFAQEGHTTIVVDDAEGEDLSGGGEFDKYTIRGVDTYWLGEKTGTDILIFEKGAYRVTMAVTNLDEGDPLSVAKQFAEIAIQRIS